MPWKGRPSFPPRLIKRIILTWKPCVNALNGATSISTWNGLLRIVVSPSVSMPWKGRPPFPREEQAEILQYLYACVNALKGATFISTGQSIRWTESFILCQCPEWGDLHFHSNKEHQYYWTGKVCQCPERGDLHFHKITGKRTTKTKNVSMPWMGRPSFPLIAIMAISGTMMCVNALKGATFISTWKGSKFKREWN